MSTDFTEQWNNMQKMFLASSEMSASFRESARRFWENQGKLLDNMQALANGWFDRRRTGTLSAREAAERMCGTKTYFDLVQEVSGLGARRIRANHRRPETNHGGNDQYARIAATDACGKRKGARAARAIRPLQDRCDVSVRSVSPLISRAGPLPTPHGVK
jgi:hypothetical protein